MKKLYLMVMCLCEMIIGTMSHASDIKNDFISPEELTVAELTVLNKYVDAKAFENPYIFGNHMQVSGYYKGLIIGMYAGVSDKKRAKPCLERPVGIIFEKIHDLYKHNKIKGDDLVFKHVVEDFAECLSSL